MEKPELSTVFDSDMSQLDPQTFNEIVMSEVEIFGEEEYNEIFQKLEGWDTQSLLEMHEGMNGFLRTLKGKSLGLSTNIVLDHAVTEGKVDPFKLYLMSNTIEFMVSAREMKQQGLMGQLEEEGE